MGRCVLIHSEAVAERAILRAMHRLLLGLPLPCLLMGLLLPTRARAAPDDFDPLLDTPPAGDGRSDHYQAADPRSPGFMVGFFGGGYFGRVRSYLTRDLSTLTAGSRTFVGFGFGVRTRSLVEFGVDLALGLGRTWEPKYSIDIAAFDLFIQPRLIFHVYESPAIGLYAGAAGEAILFDVEPEGLSQAGIGPAAVVGALHRLGDHSFIYLEATGSAFYDVLAYHFEAPSEEALAEDPTLEPRKVDGAWYGIGRITVGYRLTGF